MTMVYIDAGHNDSGWNTGATGNGLREQDVNFAVAKHLGEMLEEKGVKTKLSRPTKETNLGRDNSSSINTRVNAANKSGADYFISIHCNAGGGTGAETLYKLYKDYAQTIHSSYIAAMGLRDRGIKLRNDLGVLNGTKMPSCLIELAFLDTAADAEILRTKQKEMAEAIAKGFFKLLGIKDTTVNTATAISKENLENMVRLKVIQSPEYWENQKVQRLNESLSSASREGILDDRINNGITDLDVALGVLIDAGIVDTPDYWRKLIEENNVLYLKDLLINIANRCRIILEKIVHAEAVGEGVDGQRLVANVVLNRHNSKQFPSGIYNVVFQEKQFEPTRNGAYQKAKPTESVKTAVSQALDGVDTSKGALFFRSTKGLEGSWHATALTYLYTHKGHAFFK